MRHWEAAFAAVLIALLCGACLAVATAWPTGSVLVALIGGWAYVGLSVAVRS